MWVVKHRDVPAGLHSSQELHQRTGPFRELEAIDEFAGGERALSADHVAHVLGGQVIMRQVDCGVAVLSEGLRQLLVITGTRRADADEYLRDGGIADSVGEFGNVA